MPRTNFYSCFFIGMALHLMAVACANGQVRIVGAGTYSTISDAVAAGSPGDVIEIDSGVYHEHDIVLTYPVTIKAAVSGTEFPQVTIDASNMGRHFLIQSTNPMDIFYIEGLRLRNGDVSGLGPLAHDGGSIRKDSGQLYISSCIVQQCSAVLGGGISNRGGPISISRSTIKGCTASSSGGGIHVTGAPSYNALSLAYCVLEENQAGLDGGGIFSVECNITVSFSDVRNNQALRDGGGCFIFRAGATHPGSNGAAVSFSTISGNSAVGSGGGLYVAESECLIFQSFVERNECTGTAATALGGGMFLERNTYLMADESHFSFNSSTGSGGGVYSQNGSDAGWIPFLGTRFMKCVFQQNTSNLSGGALEIRFSGKPYLDQCEIFANVAGSGGGAISVVRMTPTSTPMPQLEDTFVCSNDAPQFSSNVGVQQYDDLGGNTILNSCSPSYGGEGEIPDPNPVANTDGTFTWYVGNNTQYPVIQSVIDASLPGDEIIVMAGLYVESLNIDLPDILLRCSTTPGGDSPEAGFQKVVFWNPTEGFDNDNSAAITLGSNTQNTHVGRPRQFTELANGSIVPTLVPFGGGLIEAEFSPDALYLPLCNNAYGKNSPMTRTQLGLAGYLGDELAMEFWSRSIDDYAIRAHDSTATINYCKITSQNGFGGGIFLRGEDNATSVVGCRIVDTYSGGITHDGYGVHGVAIHGGNPMFSGCVVSRNTAGSGGRAFAGDMVGGGVIHQQGGRGLWSGCLIGGRGYQDMNSAPVSNGIYVITKGASPRFSRCTIRCNLSRFGTVYFDSTENRSNDLVLFTRCDFLENTTVSTQYGAVAWCLDEVEGRSPLIAFDLCRWFNSNQSGTETGYEYWEKDVWSNYFPRYRLLRDITENRLSAAQLGLPGSGASTGAEATEVGDLNGDGRVDGLDLAAVLAGWS